MSATAGKPPKKEKARKQTPQEREEGLRYIHMMYGPTAGEAKLVARKTNLGSAYLNHPKFQALLEAFKKAGAFQFSVTDKGRSYMIATTAGQITFDGKVLFYAREVNRYEDNLLMDRTTAIQFQNTDALIHLAGAVLRSLPELGPCPLTSINHKLYFGPESFETAAAENGPNFLVGSFKHKRVSEGTKR